MPSGGWIGSIDRPVDFSVGASVTSCTAPWAPKAWTDKARVSERMALLLRQMAVGTSSLALLPEATVLRPTETPCIEAPSLTTEGSPGATAQRIRQVLDAWLKTDETIAPRPARSSTIPVAAARRARELRWIEKHRQTYKDKWVVLEGDTLVACGDDAVQVYREARERGVEIPFVVYVTDPLDAPLLL